MNLFEFGMLTMQVGAGLVAVYNRQYTKCCYWLGAFILTAAVIKGLK